MTKYCIQSARYLWQTTICVQAYYWELINHFSLINPCLSPNNREGAHFFISFVKTPTIFVITMKYLK